MPYLSGEVKYMQRRDCVCIKCQLAPGEALDTLLLPLYHCSQHRLHMAAATIAPASESTWDGVPLNKLFPESKLGWRG